MFSEPVADQFIELVPDALRCAANMNGPLVGLLGAGAENPKFWPVINQPGEATVIRRIDLYDRHVRVRFQNPEGPYFSVAHNM
jgi:hypothetical protein